MTSNMTWTLGHAGANNLGYSAGCNNPSVTNNYFSNGTAFKIVNCSGVSVTGNTFYGAVVGFSSSSYPNNTFFSSQPTGVKTFVRASAYESGRANITVYNWAGRAPCPWTSAASSPTATATRSATRRTSTALPS